MPRKQQTNEYKQTLREQTEIELRKLAKRANQRLRQLEKDNLSDASKAYHRIELWAYNQNKEFITTTKDGKIKFKTTTTNKVKNEKGKTVSKKRTTRQLQAEIKQLNIFLNARSSTVSGINSMYKQAFETFKKNTGYTGTYKEYSEMMAEDIISWAYRTYISEIVTDIIKNLGIDSAKDFFKQARIKGWSQNELYNQAFGSNVTFESAKDIFDKMQEDEGESINV